MKKFRHSQKKNGYHKHKKSYDLQNNYYETKREIIGLGTKSHTEQGSNLQTLGRIGDVYWLGPLKMTDEKHLRHFLRKKKYTSEIKWYNHVPKLAC